MTVNYFINTHRGIVMIVVMKEHTNCLTMHGFPNEFQTHIKHFFEFVFFYRTNVEEIHTARFLTVLIKDKKSSFLQFIFAVDWG